MNKRKLKIGLALGGGGAKGSAHIGVLKVLERYGIKISSIVGTSAGAIIGGAYALGMGTEEILRVSHEFGNSKLFRANNFHLFHDGLIKSEIYNKGIKMMVGQHTFDDIKIPFKAVAINLESGEEILLDNGKLWEALRASSAIPGIFSPYFLDDQCLIDGGLFNNVPYNYLRKQNMDLIIGVELQDIAERQYISGIVWKRHYKKPKGINPILNYINTLKINSTIIIHILRQTISILENDAQKHRYAEGQPDIIIKPKVNHIAVLDFAKCDEAVALGIEATELIMPELLKLIEEKKKTVSDLHKFFSKFLKKL